MADDRCPGIFMQYQAASFADLPSRVFLSHAYADQAALTALVSQLPDHVQPVIHPPNPADPEQAVSDGIVVKLLACDALIYLRGGRSAESPWVAFERDFALRAGRPVFGFEPESGQLAHHHEPLGPLQCAILASSAQRGRIASLLTWMADERQFRLDTDATPTRMDEIPLFVAEFLEEGVPALWFLDRRVDALATLSLHELDPELLADMSPEGRPALAYEGATDWIRAHSLYARIDPGWQLEAQADPATKATAATYPVEEAFRSGRAVDLVPDADHEALAFDWNRADDLIVRLTRMGRRVRPFFETPG